MCVVGLACAEREREREGEEKASTHFQQESSSFKHISHNIPRVPRNFLERPLGFHCNLNTKT